MQDLNIFVERSVGIKEVFHPDWRCAMKLMLALLNTLNCVYLHKTCHYSAIIPFKIIGVLYLVLLQIKGVTISLTFIENLAYVVEIILANDSKLMVLLV